MSLRSLVAPLRALRIAPSPIAGPSRVPARSASTHASLGNLKPGTGSTKERTRVGRGVGSRTGRTSGRGNNGHNARSGHGTRLSFEGGQTPFWKKLPKRGNQSTFLKKEFAPVSVARLQQWISQGRLDPENTITIYHIVRSGLVSSMSRLNGVKLLGDIDPELPIPKVDLELSQFSKSAAKAIIDAGGSVKAVYYNKLGLRQLVMPHKFVGREVRNAKPTRKADILYYTDARKHGYLADNVDAYPLMATSPGSITKPMDNDWHGGVLGRIRKEQAKLAAEAKEKAAERVRLREKFKAVKATA